MNKAENVIQWAKTKHAFRKKITDIPKDYLDNYPSDPSDFSINVEHSSFWNVSGVGLLMCEAAVAAKAGGHKKLSEQLWFRARELQPLGQCATGIGGSLVMMLFDLDLVEFLGVSLGVQ